MLNKSLSTRREFLHKGLGLLAAGATVPGFLNRTAWAMADPADVKSTQQPTGKDGKILVVVQLSGGNDGLNMIVPHGDDAYYQRRPGIGIPAKEVLRLNDHVGMHPNLTGLKELYDQGNLSVIQGVGYPNPNRSHFRSMDIWHSARPDKAIPTSGWLGQYFDNTCKGEDPHVGVALHDQLPLAMRGERVRPLTFEHADAYRYNGKEPSRYQKLIGKPTSKGDETSAAGQLDFLERTALDAQVSSDRIVRLVKGHTAASQYPATPFGNSLRTVAAMIRGGLPTRVYYVSLGGFDTHANQRTSHDQLMRQLGTGLKAFWDDMGKQKNAQRVLVMTFSEFGRRVEQNASGGTDHGAAAPMFLMGQKIQQGLVGRHPSLTDLDQGDLKFNVDFRSVYATILEKWLETPSKPVLGQAFPVIGVI